MATRGSDEIAFPTSLTPIETISSVAGRIRWHRSENAERAALAAQDRAPEVVGIVREDVLGKSGLDEGSWIVEPALAEDVFTDDPEDLWSAVLRRKGGPFRVLAAMPPDPSRN